MDRYPDAPCLPLGTCGGPGGTVIIQILPWSSKAEIDGPVLFSVQISNQLRGYWGACKVEDERGDGMRRM